MKDCVDVEIDGSQSFGGNFLSLFLRLIDIDNS